MPLGWSICKGSINSTHPRRLKCQFLQLGPFPSLSVKARFGIIQATSCASSSPRFLHTTSTKVDGVKLKDTCSTNTTLQAVVKETVCAEKGCPTNFHSSTFSSNFRPTMRELGAKISERLLAGNSLCVNTTIKGRKE